jgi:biotin transporter BioY
MPLFILGYVLTSLLIGFFGRNLRFRFWGYFFSSILFTPVIGCLMLLAAIPVQSRRKA